MASPFMLAPCPVGSLNHKHRFAGIPFRFNHFVKCSRPYFERAGRGAGSAVPQLWLYAENDSFYTEPLILTNYGAFTAVGGTARLQFYRDFSGDGHRIRQFPIRWREVADQFIDGLS